MERPLFSSMIFHPLLALFWCGAGRRAEPPCGRLPLAFQTDLQEQSCSFGCWTSIDSIERDAMDITCNCWNFHRISLNMEDWDILPTRTWPTVWDTQTGAGQLSEVMTLRECVECEASLWKYLLEQRMDTTTKIDENSERVDWYLRSHCGTSVLCQVLTGVQRQAHADCPSASTATIHPRFSL